MINEITLKESIYRTLLDQNDKMSVIVNLCTIEDNGYSSNIKSSRPFKSIYIYIYIQNHIYEFIYTCISNCILIFYHLIININFIHLIILYANLSCSILTHRKLRHHRTKSL
jgi:hypothetical protein